MKNIFYIVVAGYLISSCSGLPIQTKADAYPAMYDDRKPLSVLVIPAINNSTAAEATDFFNVTITEPLSNVGYYTMPVEIVKDNEENYEDYSRLYTETKRYKRMVWDGFSS